MDKSQVNNILIFLSDIYPNFEFPLETERSTKRKISSWALYLKDYESDIAKEAIKKLSDEQLDFPPSAPRLEKECSEVKNEHDLIEQQRKREQYLKGEQEKAEATIEKVKEKNPEMFNDEIIPTSKIMGGQDEASE